MADGVFSKYEMLNKVLILLDSVSVQGAKSVLALSNVFQMLSALQKGLKDEDSAKNQTIEILKEQLKHATEPVNENCEKIVGGEHYDLNYGGDGDGSN